MDILGSIYQLLIGPLELFFEVVFSIAYRFVGNPGISIIFLSLAMNFLVLPLYRRADAMQEEERDRAAKMKPWTDHIKKTFKGDERFMMLQTYNRQCGYKQTDALKGSISLLLEIPFFIAAYHFLSNLELLRGVPFGPIADLGVPDALICIGDITINFLPLLMTAINVVAAAIYMKGFPLSSKVQMYGIAAIFLVLLYGSPAGLVFYWTLNNIFSLVKNIFYKLKNPKRVLLVMASAAGVVALMAAVAISPSMSMKRVLFLVLLALLLEVPLLVKIVGRKKAFSKIPEAGEKDDRAFFIGCLFLALLTGVLIPMSVIQSSPSEFVSLVDYKSPLWCVLDSFLLAFGTFVIWFGVFYRLATPSGRYVFGAVIWVLCGVFLIDYLFFGTTYGMLSPSLEFGETPTSTLIERLVNLVVIAVVALGMLFIWKKKKSVAGVAYASLSVAIVAVTVFGVVQVNDALENSRVAAASSQEDRPAVSLSKSGNNVIVIMMDREVSYFIPYIMNENPVIKEQFNGFTYYPNSLSYGSLTNVGSPGLYGGYEYTPEHMNERSDLSLGEKHNEALRVMPVLFNQAGFDVTVFDPTYAGYSWTPDLSIYDDHPDIHAYISMDGSFETDEFGLLPSLVLADQNRSRNFFCYSLFKVSPLLIQPTLYNGGKYNSPSALSRTRAVDELSFPQVRHGISRATGVDENFLKSYAVLEQLPSITSVTDSTQGCFFMMSNDTTHSPTLLQEPECIPAATVDNVDYDREHAVHYDENGNSIDFTNDVETTTTSKHMHYQIGTAALRELGQWFDYLRERGVYDNTRIIVVSDHGQHLDLVDDLHVANPSPTKGGSNGWDMQIFNCTLMVKDFDSTEFTVDEQFMTNADTPSLAFEGLIENPVNPSTGNPINTEEKNREEQHVAWPEYWNVSDNNGNTFLPMDWFALSGAMNDSDSWSYLGYY